MKLIIIFGGVAAGKMTVAQELAKITDLRLFHTHMTVESVIETFGDFRLDVIMRLRDVVFDEFVTTDLYGMIITGCWELENPEHWAYFTGVAERFINVGGEVYYVNLIASQEVRLKRNESEHRLQHKPSMRNKEASRKRLLDRDAMQPRWEANDGEFAHGNFIKIDNTNLSADLAAKMIKDNFDL